MTDPFKSMRRIGAPPAPTATPPPPPNPPAPQNPPPPPAIAAYVLAPPPAVPSIPRALPGQTRVPPQPVLRSFRRNILDRQDPFEGAGRSMPNFSYPGNYALRGEPGPRVVDEIQETMLQRLADGALDGASVEVIDFNDAAFRDEPPRRFIVTQKDTRRRTLVTVNAYVQACGDHLYYSVRSYLLPPRSLVKLVLAVLFILFLFGAPYVLTRGGEEGVPSGVMVLRLFLWTVSLLIAGFTFRRLFRNLYAGDPLSTALRKQFPGGYDDGTFDDDDVASFLRTSLQLTLGSIASVLDAHGIEVSGLKSIVQTLQTVNNYSASGTFVGAIFGGTGNSATGKVGP